MAVSKQKKVKQVNTPRDNYIGQGGNPDQYYSEYPVWKFAMCDKLNWSICHQGTQEIFFDKIIPRLQEFERKKWQDILIGDKKNNHSIDVTRLNKTAIKRLSELNIEAESIISLRFEGRIRVYGYNEGCVFKLLWFDLDHGDNDTCVCKSRKKYT